MGCDAETESFFKVTEAISAVRIVALALNSSGLTEVDIRSAGKILTEAHFSLESELLSREEILVE